MSEQATAPKRPAISVQPEPGRVTVHVEGVLVADTNSALVLTEGKLPPRHYLPADDVRMELLAPTDTRTTCPWKGDASYWAVTVADAHYEDVVWAYPDPIPEMAQIAGLMSFYAERPEVDQQVGQVG